jgi:hypothetical protein
MGSTQSLRIVVTGLIAQHPSLGGVAWDYVQYPLGLHRLGHDVYYIEDSGEWPYTTDGGASGQDWIAYDCSPNVAHLKEVMERFGLSERWAYRFPIKPRWFGMPHAKRREVLRSADLLINVSGSLEQPGDYRNIRRLAYLDSDPVFTQIKLALPQGHLKFRKRVDLHDIHFSFGECLSTAVPSTPYTWRPTRQPIVVSEWSSPAPFRPVYSTIMSWTSYKPLRFEGRLYAQKDYEFRRFVSLASLVAPVPVEIAMHGTRHATWQSLAGEGSPAGDRPGADGFDPRQFLRAAGWRVVDAREVAGGLDSYRSYVLSSKGEWSVAKNGYVEGRPGWFSCRSGCYLAAGRPVIVQDTGFVSVLPTGVGVLSFSTTDEAAEAIRRVESNYHQHAQAAREIAEAYFAADLVLSRLIEEAMTVHAMTDQREVHT